MARCHLNPVLPALLAAALLSACAVAPSNTPSSAAKGATTPSAPQTPPVAPVPPAPVVLALAGTEWVAFAISGKAEVLAPKPRLRWLSADKVSGTGGCNGFAGPAVVGPDTLRLGPLASTGRACLSMPGSQEDRYFKALEDTRKARLEGDQLVLMDESGKQLVRFLKAP